MYQSTKLNRAQGTWKGMRLKFFLHVCLGKINNNLPNFFYTFFGGSFINDVYYKMGFILPLTYSFKTQKSDLDESIADSCGTS